MSDCSPLAKAQWQYGKQRQLSAVAIWDVVVAIWNAVVINGSTDANIKCWPYSESNPEYVLSGQFDFRFRIC
jgi:hypothetical protein